MEIQKWRDGTAIGGIELIADCGGWDELGRPRVSVFLESAPLKPEAVPDPIHEGWKIEWVSETGERGDAWPLSHLGFFGSKEEVEAKAAIWGKKPVHRPQAVQFTYDPPLLETPLFGNWEKYGQFLPLKRAATPEEIAEAVAFRKRAIAHFGHKEPARIVAAQEGEIYLPTISPPDPEEGRGRGRPRIRSESRDIRVQVRITPSLNEKLEAGAQAAGITPAEHAFLLLERALLKPEE